MGIRTLGLANALVSVARTHGNGTLDASGSAEHMESMLTPLIDPCAASRLKRRMARDARRAAAAEAKAAATAAGGGGSAPAASGGDPADAAASP
jgi:hypothetical protein